MHLEYGILVKKCSQSEISDPYLGDAEGEVVAAGRQRSRRQLDPRRLHPRREHLLEGLAGLLQRVARLPLVRLADPVVGERATLATVILRYQFSVVASFTAVSYASFFASFTQYSL